MFSQRLVYFALCRSGVEILRPNKTPLLTSVLHFEKKKIVGVAVKKKIFWIHVTLLDHRRYQIR